MNIFIPFNGTSDDFPRGISILLIVAGTADELMAGVGLEFGVNDGEGDGRDLPESH